MANRNKDWTAEDSNVYEQLPANQLSNLDNNDVESVVQDIVGNVHTQDRFSNPPPVSNSQKKKEKKRKRQQ